MSRAVQYRRFGGPEVLELLDVPVPEPGPGEVLVAVQAAGLNPVDAKTVAGAFPIKPAEAVQRLRHPSRWFTRTFPRTVGRDFAGVVEATGPGVAGLAVGQAVLGTLRSAPGDATQVGSLATHLVAPVADVVPLPPQLDATTAASLGVAAQTGCGALRTLEVGPGDVLAISGATGGVGSLATQLAVQRGATVLGIANPASAEKLRSWGATPVSYSGDVAANLRAATATPVTKFLDCFGGDYARMALGLGVPAQQVGTLVPSPGALVRGVRFTGSRAARPGDLELVAGLVAEGKLHPQPVRTMPFELQAARAACRQLLDGSAHEKLVITMDGQNAAHGTDTAQGTGDARATA